MPDPYLYISNQTTAAKPEKAVPLDCNLDTPGLWEISQDFTLFH